MKIAAVSDLHGHMPEIPECDLLLIAGDITPLGDHSVLTQLTFLNGPFREWLKSVPAKRICGVAGNHDWIFERTPHMVPTDLPWTYLQDSWTTEDGRNIYGSPHQPVFYSWAFNADDEKRKLMWSRIPDGTEILVLHGPPYGFGDYAPPHPGSGRMDGEHVGCKHLLARIKELPDLKLVVFGHIHAGYGRFTLGDVTLANVSLVNEKYVPTNMVQTFEL